MTRTLTQPTRQVLRTPRFLRVAAVSGIGFSACVLGGTGCQQMAAVETARSVVPAAQAAMQAAQTTAQGAQSTAQAAVQGAANVVNGIPGSQIALNAIPQFIKDMANNILNFNRLDWGKPRTVYYHDGVYAFVYPNSGMFGSGKPRIIYVDTLGPIARLERLQKQGY